MEKVLYRSCKNRMIAGVCGGIGEYFDFDPTLIRLIWALSLLSGFGALAYLFAWIIIPPNPECESPKTGAEEIKKQAERVADEIREATKNMKGHHPRNHGHFNDSAAWLGIIIIVAGLLLLSEQFLGLSFWRVFWPAFLVIVGVAVFASAAKK